MHGVENFTSNYIHFVPHELQKFSELQHISYKVPLKQDYHMTGCPSVHDLVNVHTPPCDRYYDVDGPGCPNMVW